MKDYQKKLFDTMLQQQKERNYTWIPSSLAFYFFIAFIPFLFSIIFLSIKYINIDVNWITNILNVEGIKPLIENLIYYIENEIGEPSLILVIVFLIYSLYVSGKGMSAVIYAINSFFGFSIPSLIKTTLIAYIMIIGITIAIFAMLLIASILPAISRLFPFNFNFTFVYLLSIPFLYAIIHIIYVVVTDFRLKSKHIYKGALLTTFLIVLLLGFSNIIFRVGTTASIVYGSLAIIILVGHFFLYLGFSIYFGIALNVASYKLEQDQLEEQKYEEFKKRFGLHDENDDNF